MATIQLLDGYTAYSENGIYHYYGTVQDWYAIDRYGSKKAWMISELTQFGHISPADTVIDIDGSVIQKGTMTAAETQAELNQQAQDIIDEAQRKAAAEVAEAEAWARMANSGTVRFAPVITRTDLVDVAQEQINATPAIVQTIIDTANQQISSIFKPEEKTMAQVGEVFETEAKTRSNIALIILIPIGILLLFYTLMRR